MQGEPAKPETSAIILAGGKSSRMGRPKALLPFDNEPLIVHIVRQLKKLFTEAIVVAAPEQELPPLPATVARDEVAYQGPVGGIYYGLKAANGKFCFVTSCDVAFPNLPLICHLMSKISNYDVVVPYWEERYQPLHAVYRRSVLPLLEEQLHRGELRPIFLYEKVRTHKIGEADIRRYDPGGLSFLNINTPQDYQSALNRWHEIRQTMATEATPPPKASVPVTVELFGVARLLAKTQEVSLALPEKPTLSHVFVALAERLPVLVGRVISTDKNSLLSGYSCNLNGLDFVRNPVARINPGDKIFVLSADAGG